MRVFVVYKQLKHTWASYEYTVLSLVGNPDDHLSGMRQVCKHYLVAPQQLQLEPLPDVNG